MSAAQRELRELCARASQATGEELVAEGERLLALGRQLLAQSGQLTGRPNVGTAAVIPEPEPPVEAVDPDERSVGRFGLVDEHAAIEGAARLRVFTRGQFAAAMGLSAPAASRWLRRLIERPDGPAIAWEAGEDGPQYRYVLDAEQEPATVRVHRWAREQEDPFDPGMVTDALGFNGEDMAEAIRQLKARRVVRDVEVIVEDPEGELEPTTMTMLEWVPELDPRTGEMLERQRQAAVQGDAAIRVQRGKAVRIRTERSSRRGRSTPGQRAKIINNERAWEALQAAQRERAEANQRRAARQATEPKKARRKRASRPV